MCGWRGAGKWRAKSWRAASFTYHRGEGRKHAWDQAVVDSAVAAAIQSQSGTTKQSQQTDEEDEQTHRIGLDSRGGGRW